MERLDRLEEKEKRWEEYQAAPDEAEERPPQFTKKDATTKARLLSEGFGGWSKKDFANFVRLCEKHGRTAYDKISAEIKGKDEAEIERYSKAFWRRWSVLEGGEKIVERIRAGEQELERLQAIEVLI